MTKQAYRRWAGFILGAVAGLIFGGISQGVNPLLLPGIPLYQPPLGMAGNIALLTALGAVLGLISAWTDSSLPGVLLSAALAAGLLLIANTFTNQFSSLMAAATVIVSILLWLPFTAIAAAGTGLMRIAVNNLTDYRADSIAHPRRWGMLLIVLAAAAGLGYTLVLSPPARTVLTRTHELLQQGLTVENAADLPAPLAGSGMNDFTGKASPGYTLKWEDKNLIRYAIPRPGGPEYLMSVVEVRFDNGWNLACLYPTSDGEPRCHSFARLP